MEAEQNSTASPFSVEEARAAGRYLAEDDTYATLVAAAATVAVPGRAALRGVLSDRQAALAAGQFVLAAEQRAGLMRELADQLDVAATLVRASLMGRRDYATLMRQADAMADAG